MQAFSHAERDDEGENIGNGLCEKYAVQAEAVGQEPNERDKTQALATGAEKAAFFSFPEHEKKKRIYGVDAEKHEGERIQL